ncbi:uncharacterized protein LOC129588167 [Paramacrobiotus metropolitanus]|uniref:uncharacterized protein LOC129588167 n=1 Tax=Paramacrobiotus metropolitanus TaxID=2943436 RepID=UPI002445F294|nr:uncharacterized protein LOC129588167 [Paramacrobiotus metropolitanus]
MHFSVDCPYYFCTGRDGIMGTGHWHAVYINVLLMVLLFPTYAFADKHPKPPKPKHGAHDSSSEEEGPSGREGLRCYKCDPTDYNNYCRDFKPNLATPYDCYIPPTDTRHSKNPTPLEVSLDPDKPFSCYKIKGDVAYGHGKVYGAKRYGCGHLTKFKEAPIRTLDHECVDVKLGKDKSKEFFEGTICNCDNADGCNAAPKKFSYYFVSLLIRLIAYIFSVTFRI